jgi:hypothetical protein
MDCSRFSMVSVALGLGLFGSGCGTKAAGEAIASAGAQLGSPGVPNAADTQCNVFLRDVADSENGGGLDTNCIEASGVSTCWVIFTGHVDISNAALLESDQPYVQYQSGTDPTWYVTGAVPTTGAGIGFQRYEFTLTQNTAIQGEPFPTIQLIPYLITTVGTHLFDHNVYANQNYILDSNNGWNIGYNGDYCYEPPAPGTATVAFNKGWTESVSGTFVQGGKLAVQYDLARMPECEGVTTDGVEAWATTANAMFLPSGEVLSGIVSGPFDAASGSWTSELFERDIPAGATSVQLWFETSGDGCQTGWDSDFGQNYSYRIGPPQ